MAESETVCEGEENDPFLPGQVCRAEEDFEGQEEGDLSFQNGEMLTIVQPAEMAFWYIARNEQGMTGTVPKTYLTAVQAGASASCDAGVVPVEQDDPGPVDEEVAQLLAKEAKRRHPPGTIVMATLPFVAQSEEDMSFKAFEEMILIQPAEDLCWYYAHMSEQPQITGLIPLTHVQLVSVSDNEDEAVYKAPTQPSHDRLYEDFEDFVKLSGWYSHMGLAPNKDALLHVLCRKANMTYESFVTITQSVYMLQYMDKEKVYVGKAEVLHKELSLHFDCFGKPRGQIRGIDDELCHHTDAAGWSITVWPLLEDQVLEVEWNKKIIEQGSLQSSEEVGMNELVFTSMDNWDKFEKWFWPT
ncbi:hypothetical protein EMCRGX_G033970 [Ephydatia muelleri]